MNKKKKDILAKCTRSFYQWLQLQKRGDNELWAKLRKFGAYVIESVPSRASARTGFQSNLCRPNAIITLNLGLPYTLMEGMSMYRRIVPNIELCNQNECILFD